MTRHRSGALSQSLTESHRVRLGDNVAGPAFLPRESQRLRHTPPEKISLREGRGRSGRERRDGRRRSSCAGLSPRPIAGPILGNGFARLLGNAGRKPGSEPCELCRKIIAGSARLRSCVFQCSPEDMNAPSAWRADPAVTSPANRRPGGRPETRQGRAARRSGCTRGRWQPPRISADDGRWTARVTSRVRPECRSAPVPP